MKFAEAVLMARKIEAYIPEASRTPLMEAVFLLYRGYNDTQLNRTIAAELSGNSQAHDCTNGG